jgi:putative tryptophan/tyrosine transport system substrate-binding protein
MRRRQFIAGLAGALATWPLHGRAKQATDTVIGFLDAGSAADRTYVAAAFRQGLAEGGYSEGQNIRIEFRWANGRFEQLPALLTDLVDRDVTMIAAFGNSAARAAKIARTTLPVVFASSSDPVAIGLVTSLNRPGANMTGVSILNQELESTRLERLIEAVPQASTIGFLVNPDSLTTTPKLQEMESAARSFGRRLHVLHARHEGEFEAVFAAIEQEQLGAMVVTSGNVFSNESATLGQVCARHTVPTIGAHRAFARAGGLMSYGTDLSEAYRRVGSCAALILSGEEPSVLPVQLSTKVEFVINLKAAKALGVEIPSGLLAIAHEIIE